MLLFFMIPCYSCSWIVVWIVSFSVLIWWGWIGLWRRSQYLEELLHNNDYWWGKILKSCDLAYSNGKAFLFLRIKFKFIVMAVCLSVEIFSYILRKLVHLPYCYFMNYYKQVCIESYHIYQGKVTLKMPHKIK